MANKASITSQQIFLVISLIVIILSFTLTSITQERIVSRSSYNIKDIVEITEIKIKGKSITLGSPFIADDNWLKGLTVKVRNTTGKPIAYIDVSLSFPETKAGEGTLGWSITYGQKPDFNKSSPFSDTIKPQKIVDIRLNKDDYKKLQEFVKERISAANISSAYIRIREVIFDDGMRWVNGYLVRRDPQNPQKWIALPRTGSAPPKYFPGLRPEIFINLENNL